MFPLIAGFNSAWNLAIAAAKSLISGDEFMIENQPLLALVVKGCRIPPLARREVLIWPVRLGGNWCRLSELSRTLTAVYSRCRVSFAYTPATAGKLRVHRNRLVLIVLRSLPLQRGTQLAPCVKNFAYGLLQIVRFHVDAGGSAEGNNRPRSVQPDSAIIQGFHGASRFGVVLALQSIWLLLPLLHTATVDLPAKFASKEMPNTAISTTFGVLSLTVRRRARDVTDGYRPLDSELALTVAAFVRRLAFHSAEV